MTQLVVAAAIVNDLERPTHLLCAQRAYPLELKGKWELPGGKVEPNEEPAVALRREIHEELDLEIELGPQIKATWDQIDEKTREAWHQIYAEGGRYAQQVEGDFSANRPSDEGDWPLVADLRMRVWVCQLADETSMPQLRSADGGHQALKWVPWETVLDLDWLPADYPIIEAIRETCKR
ncbi:(deoxy)nucleoside triphosphate pyrophosphohydrolase [Boudabousia tangfeifanii]|nr:NUDIX domain-containing protein [Boudabousia tangfeifanii]